MFDHLDSNYDVEALLIKEGVILPEDQPDSETCALVVNFKSVPQGYAFLVRLNSYLERAAAQVGTI